MRKTGAPRRIKLGPGGAERAFRPRQDGAGQVVVLERQENGLWTQTAAVHAPSPDRDGRFGSRVALDGDRFVAVAYDTLDTPMSGITFAWSSSNPSVAQLESTTAASTDARSAANGLANIRATVHGVTGSAPLTVQQALAGIQVTPASATIGVSGTVGTIARGIDANGFYISGGSFAFTSSTPAVATVGAATGIVTGVGLALVAAAELGILPGVGGGADRSVLLAFAGIGRPEKFFESLTGAGATDGS